MRRPSPIPQQTPPVEPEPPVVPPRPTTREDRGRGAGDPGVRGYALPDAAGGTAEPTGSAARPVRLEPRRTGTDTQASAATSPAPTDVPVADADAPLGPRDLWRAARARRRALRAEIRRFTQRSRRRRIAWAVGLLVTALVVGGSVGAAYSPLFAVERITVDGTHALPAADVQKALSGQLGRPLALVDSSAVKAALVRFPLIETYQLEAHPPHDLVVRIVERTPVGVIAAGHGFTVVDAAGVPLSTTADRPGGYALIDVAGGTDGSAFRAVGTVMRALPAELRSKVDGVTAATPDDIVLQLGGGGPKIVWGSADRSALKSVTLQKLMAASPGHATYDVSSPGVGVVG